MDGSAPRVDDGEDEDEEELTPELQLRTDRSGGFGEKAFCSEGGREGEQERGKCLFLFLVPPSGSGRRQAGAPRGRVDGAARPDRSRLALGWG